jgi:hypothetical protein
LVHLSTVAHSKSNPQPWVKFQLAGWVNIQLAPTGFKIYPREYIFCYGSHFLRTTGVVGIKKAEPVAVPLLGCDVGKPQISAN